MNKQIAEAIVGFLNSAASSGGSVSDPEALTLAAECVASTFSISPATTNTTLVDMFSSPSSSSSSSSSSSPAPGAGPLSPALMEKLTAQGYFEGTTPGSAEYQKRVDLAAAKFAARFSGNTPTDRPVDESPGGEEDKEAGTALKKEGNTAFQAGDLDLALEKYSAAIKAFSTDATFYANRAAVYLRLDRALDAVEDCRKAVSLDPEYTKAYRRMGSAYMALGQAQDAIDLAYEPALAIDPDSELTLGALAAAREALGTQDGTSIPVVESPRAEAAGAPPAGGMPAGMPDLAGLASMFGGAGGAGGMPDMSQLLNNPMVAQMAQQMAQNPEMMQNLMGMMGGMGGPPQ